MRGIKPSQLEAEIDTNARCKRNTMIWGGPGIGKSQLVYQAAKRHNALVFEIRANLYDPVDVRGGLKVVEQKNGTFKTCYGIPEDYPDTNYTGPVWVFIDELPNATKATMSALMQLLLDRKIGTYVLPPQTVMVAAGNRAQDRAAVHEMPTPVKDRFDHYTLEPDVDDFTAYAHKAGIDESIISFVRFKPQYLHAVTPTENAWPTPRAWEGLSQKLPHMSDWFYGTASVVGDGVAGEYLAFREIYKELPTIEDIIARPTSTKVPEKPSTLFAVAGQCAAHATNKDFKQILKYIERLPPEYQVCAIKDSLGKDKSLITNEHFQKWTVDNADVFL
jgi:hypothetical protein